MRLQQYCNSTNEKQEITTLSNWILSIGDRIADGIKDYENEELLGLKYPKKYLIQYITNPIEHISTIIYDDFQNNF